MFVWNFCQGFISWVYMGWVREFGVCAEVCRRMKVWLRLSNQWVALLRAEQTAGCVYSPSYRVASSLLCGSLSLNCAPLRPHCVTLYMICAALRHYSIYFDKYCAGSRDAAHHSLPYSTRSASIKKERTTRSFSTHSPTLILDSLGGVLLQL